jgi:hypothetical protein
VLEDGKVANGSRTKYPVELLQTMIAAHMAEKVGAPMPNR